MRGEGAAAVALLALAVFGSCGGGGGGTYAPAAAAAPAAPAAAKVAPGSGTAALAECVGPVPDLSGEQAGVAVRAYRAAQRAGAGAEGAVIIIAAGIVESNLRNLTYGDRDSLGWLQQRPSQGWANARDVDRAADDFFADMKKRVPGWRGMDPGAVAQAVQRSAYPTRYAEQIPRARAIVAAIEGRAAECATPAPVAGECKPSGSPAENGLRPNALRVLRCGKHAWPFIKHMGGVGPRPNPSDHGAGNAVDFMIPAWNTQQGREKGWEVARWFEKNSGDLRVKYLIWDAKIWKPSTRQWRPYKHPTGGTTPTLMHLDHVHVSVVGS